MGVGVGTALIIGAVAALAGTGVQARQAHVARKSAIKDKKDLKAEQRRIEGEAARKEEITEAGRAFSALRRRRRASFGSSLRGPAAAASAGATQAKAIGS